MSGTVGLARILAGIFASIFASIVEQHAKVERRGDFNFGQSISESSQIAGKLRQLKGLLDEGLISQEEFNAKRQKLLDEM